MSKKQGKNIRKYFKNKVEFNLEIHWGAQARRGEVGEEVTVLTFTFFPHSNIWNANFTR